MGGGGGGANFVWYPRQSADGHSHCLHASVSEVVEID